MKNKKMKFTALLLKVLYGAFLTFITSFNSVVASDPARSTHSLESESKKIIQKFAGELKAELQAAVKAGGLANGVDVCSTRAGNLALENSNSNWQISRTSLKPRNPENQPTSDETMVLLQFEQRLKAGEKIADLVYSRQNADGSYHMMKAIPTQSVCLACHGQSISADVQQVLREKYPQDKATGYEAGQIRGAFSLTYTP